MSAFFTYLENPAQFLQKALPLVRKKTILDWNFRSPCSFIEAAQTLQLAGLNQIEWRPWLIPYTAPRASRSKLRMWIEARPNLSLLWLMMKRWHYTIHLKGDKFEATGRRDDLNRGEFYGNRLQGSLVQRSLIRIAQITK